MPYKSCKKSKSSKNSNNSKSGGRRRKHTMRKYRRGRKVMRGGEYIFTNDELIQAYARYVQRHATNAVDQLRMNVFPTLFTLTDVGIDSPIDNKHKVPEFWMKTWALEDALNQDTKLKTKISNNAVLIKELELKTPQQKADEAKAADARKLVEDPRLSDEERANNRWNNSIFWG